MILNKIIKLFFDIITFLREICDVAGDILKRLMRRKLTAVSLILVCFYIILAVSGEAYRFYCRKTNTIAVYEQTDMDRSYQAPSLSGGSGWLGTDYAGRDVLWRAMAAAGTAVKIGIFASIISAVIGVTLGLLGGYFGGWIDDLVVWVYSTFASMPTLLFILAFALLVTRGFLFPPLKAAFETAAAGLNTDPGMMAIYLAVGITGWVGLCRVVRGETLRLREMPYVQAAKTLGFNNLRILLKHILPNVFHLVIIYFTMRFAYAIMTEVIVSYLGLGVESAPSWGRMIADGQERLWRGIWWEVATATVFMFFLVLPLNLLGDALRDLLDPKLQG